MATNNEIEFKQILNENVYHQIRNTYFENDKNRYNNLIVSTA